MEERASRRLSSAVEMALEEPIPEEPTLAEEVRLAGCVGWQPNSWQRIGRRMAAPGRPAAAPPPMRRALPDAPAAAWRGTQVAKLPPWRSTITPRALLIGAVLGAAFSIISLKLGLTTGVIPSLNIAAGLLGYFFLGGLSKFLAALKIGGQPMTRQEVTVIQTCTVACYGMAFNGGFGTCECGGRARRRRRRRRRARPCSPAGPCSHSAPHAEPVGLR